MDLSKYAALFLAESREHLNACNGSLLEWERAPTSLEPVDRLFRAIHTIKGMAATMGHAGVAQLAHAAENLLDAIRHNRVSADPAIFQLLFRVVDTLGGAVEAADGTEQAADADLIAELDAAALASQDTRTRAEANPESDDSQALPTSPAIPESKLRRATDAPRSRPVQVVISRGAAMRGARAALVLRRAEAFGAVSGVQPPLAQLERDEFDGRFFFRLQSERPEQEIEATLMAVGEVQSVKFEEPALGGGRWGTSPPDPSRSPPAGCPHEAGGRARRGQEPARCAIGRSRRRGPDRAEWKDFATRVLDAGRSARLPDDAGG